MGKIREKYLMLGDGEIIKSYRTFKEALKDLDFFKLMYTDICIYQLVVKNGEEI